jgi:predicted permease
MKFLLSAVVFLIFPALAFAGIAPVPEPEMSSNNDIVAPLLLIAIVGAVIATSAMSGAMATKRESDPFLLPQDDKDN